MRALPAHARIVLLSGTALLLGAWTLIGMRSGASTDPQLAGQALEPVGDQGVLVSTGSSRPGSGVAVVDGPEQGSMLSASLPRRERILVGDDVLDRTHERPDAGYVLLLDRVFGPGRVRRDPAAAASNPVHHQETGTGSGVAHRRELGWSTVQGSQPVPSDQREGRRPKTEKAYYEEFLALGKKDAQELLGHADAVLSGDGENCEKVAMLRALYATDRSRALDAFVRAIVSLPDRSQPEGVSVPAFAVAYLAKRVSDPAVQVVVERIAWSDYLNVSTDLRRLAEEALAEPSAEAGLR